MFGGLKYYMYLCFVVRVQRARFEICLGEYTPTYVGFFYSIFFTMLTLVRCEN